MTNKTRELGGWLRLAALLIAPALLGAKGCGVGTVGNDVCGGLQGKECAAGYFCHFEQDDACGAADQTGVCAAIPSACTTQYDPVCGCDDVTYSNECAANAAGISVSSSGKCTGGTPPPPGTGDQCGGLLGAVCSKGEFCNYSISAACGAADQTGVCNAVPQVCGEIFAPVCGCDQKTYENECSANAAGVSIGAKGACASEPAPGTGKQCGGLLGVSCAKGEFCDFPAAAACGAADQTGTCAVVPQVCTQELSPVCGCDDVTYSNACAANAKGISVASKGECASNNPGKVCGTRGAAACATGEFCNFPSSAQCGQTDKPGICTPKPEGCTDIYSPVCGCDGVTYGNACEANVAGASVASSGKCGAPTSKTCGGLLGARCAEGEFCNFPATAQCGAADQTGTCEVLPQGCPKNILQVCGCDGKTYDNACVANQAGTSVVSEGACKATGKGCGARLGDTCSKGEFCHFPDAAICGAADGTGICEAVPSACTKEYSAVCGCDGMTYSNSCMANAAGTSVSKKGTCEDTGSASKQCGGLTGLPCAKNEFCDFAIDAQCGAADQLGTCRTKPQVCTADYTPVCGCDDKTYSNACAAQGAGVSVASKGACSTDPNCKPSLVAPSTSCR